MNKTDLEAGMIVEYASSGCGPHITQMQVIDLGSWMPAYPEQRHVIDHVEVRGYFTPTGPPAEEQLVNWAQDYVLARYPNIPDAGTLLRVDAITRVISRSIKVNGQWVPAA
jgi:hypothetical protein